ncbi:hypothetical protein GGI12_002272 [Dipsacomyces acuminosporus]|nr:hypothetical protein GGI12_002272 [Dipsacomyces acuminosporus]
MTTATSGLSGEYPALRKLDQQVALTLDLIKDAIKGLSRSGVSSDKHILDSMQRPPTLDILTTLEELQGEIVRGRESKNEDEKSVDPLGLRDRKAVVQAIDLLVVFELEPRLFPGIGVPLSQRVQSNAVSALSQLRQRAPSWNPSDQINLAELAMRLVNIVESCVGLTDVASILINRYIGDILAALLQTAYAPIQPTASKGKVQIDPLPHYVEYDSEKRIDLRKAFTRLFSRSEAYLLLESLTTLMTAAVTHKPKPGPKWFRTMCGRFLSRVLLRPAGVRITIDYMVSGDEDPTTEKLDKLANLLLTSPAGTSDEEYLAKVLPQVFKLAMDANREDQAEGNEHQAENEAIRLAMDEKTRHNRIEQAAVYVLRELAEKNKVSFCTYVVEPVAAPLLKWFGTRQRKPPPGNESVGDSSRNEIVEEVGDGSVQLDDPILRGLEAKVSTKAAGKQPMVQIIDSISDSAEQDSKLYGGNINTLVSSDELQVALARISRLVLHGVPSTALLAEIVVPVFVPLFYWYAFETSLTEGTTNNASALKDILVTTLRLLPQQAALSVVLNLIQTVRGGDTSEGDVEEDWPVFATSPQSKTAQIVWHADAQGLPMSQSKSQIANGEDGDKLQREGDQRFISMGALLDIIGSDSLKGIVGSIFITVLREQEALLELVRESSTVSAQLLTRKWWLISQAAIAMVERFGPAVLTKHIHVLAFILNTLERAQEAIASIAKSNSDQGGSETGKAKGDTRMPEGVSIEALLDSLSMDKLTQPADLQKDAGEMQEEAERSVGETEMVILALMLLSQIMLASNQGTFDALAAMTSGQPAELPSQSQREKAEGMPAIRWDEQSLKLLRSILGQVKLLSDQRAVPMLSQLAGEVKLQVVMVLALNGSAVDSSSSESAGESGAHEVGDAEEVRRFNAALRDINDDMVPVKAHGIVELRNMVLGKSSVFQGSSDRLDTVIDIFTQMVKSSDSFIYLNAVRGLSALADMHGQKFVSRLVHMYCQDGLPLDERVRVGEALLQTVLRAGQALPKLSPMVAPHLIGSIAHSSGDLEDEESESAIMAHSALSILSAMAQTSALSLQRWMTDIATLLSDLLLLPKTAVVLRRAAVVFWVSLVRGYGQRLLQLVDPEILRTVYRTLRRVESSDSDELTRMHARVGIEELDEGIRDQLLSNYLQ